MNYTTVIPTDLITPLGAYVRLRGDGQAAFLLESVEQGRLGRYSFVGCGTRCVSLDEAEQAGAPVVGYVSYDHVAALEPTVPLPEDGPDIPESRFIVADTLLRFDHPGGVAAVLHGDVDTVREVLEAPAPELPRGSGTPGPMRRHPDQAAY